MMDGQRRPHCKGSSPDSQSSSSTSKMLPHRACEECKRKKTKCDMKRPICSLCARTGSECIFPTRRKPPTFKNKVLKPQPDPERERIRNEQIDKLLELIASGNFQASGISRRMSDDGSPLNMAELSSSIPFMQQPSASPYLGIPHVGPGMPTLPSTPGFERRPAPPGPPPSFQFQEPVFGEPLMYPFANDELLMPPANDLLPDLDLFQASLNTTYADHLSPPATDLESGFISGGSSSRHPSPSPSASTMGSLATFARLTVPDAIADHLIELYFAKVHGFVPILHKQTIYSRFAGTNPARYQNLPADQALLLYSMFAITARFSPSEYFLGVRPKDRGNPYAVEALSLVQRHVVAKIGEDAPTVTALQGTVLAGYYWLSRGPNLQSWALTNIVCRIALSLGLSSVDVDFLGPPATHPELSPSLWAVREGARRIWWAVVDLDNHGSFLSGRTTNLDPSRMHVLLPAADHDWYTETPLVSSFLDPEPLSCWRSLQGSENRNPHAWYLVANHISLLTHEMARSIPLSQESRDTMETAISCFAMSLPEEFDLDSGNLTFAKPFVAHCNWVIALHLTLHAARSLLIHVEAALDASPFGAPASLPQLRSGPGPPGPSLSSSSTAAMISPAANEARERALLRCRPLLSNVTRAVRAWSPEHIPLTLPFLILSLMGPYVLFLRCMDTAFAGNAGATAVKELLELTMAREAKYWSIGGLVLELFGITAISNPVSPGANTELRIALTDRFAALLPPHLTGQIWHRRPSGQRLE